MNQPLIPIALFAYARPGHLRQTLEALKRNRVPLIYAFSDGPKDEDKVEQVNEVRKLLRAVDWAELILIERETNLGLGPSIRSGVSEVLEKFDMVIVVEDDIVLRPGAYKNTCNALIHYRSNPRVMSISMWNHRRLFPGGNANGFFSERFICWGWGTYKEMWKLYTGSPKEVYLECIKNNIKPEIWGRDILWQVENAEKRNLWYVGYLLTHLLNNKISYFPGEPWTINIGRDATGENTSGGIQDDQSLIEIPVRKIISFPEKVDKLQTIQKRFRKYFRVKSRFEKRLHKIFRKWIM